MGCGAHSLHATVEFCPNGRVCVRCATQDIGTGTYTLFAQVAACEDRRTVWTASMSSSGDTSLAGRADIRRLDGDKRHSAGGHRAVNQAVTRLLNIAAQTPGSPFHGAKPDSLTIADGRVRCKRQRRRS